MGAVDLFSGPRGWDVGARSVGLEDALGIDVDEAACATSEAAGFPTLRADVAGLEPLDFGPCERLIASPPCQARSMAGKRGGERDLQHVFACLRDLAAGNDTRARHLEACEDARSMLVVEPLRWALALRPTHVALEQVPPVIEEWRLVAEILRSVGYRTWTGILSAERYGVPQTRRRAILMASLDGPVHPPAPTHQAYVPGVPAREQHTLEGTLLPWVSMAEALGWGDGVVGFPRRNDQPSDKPAAGDDGEYRARDLRSTGEPAFNLTEKARSWTLRAGTNDHDAKRAAEEPAPTMRFGARPNDVSWVPSHMAKKEDRPERKAQGAGNQPRAIDTPAATIDTRTDLAAWVDHRPATTIRVTLEEALILQGFPPDYPVQGSRTKQFEQVGNAVPPPLGAAVLAALVPVSLRAVA